MTERVGTVVLNYLHPDDTVRCVASVQRSEYSNGSVLVIDNGSGSDVLDTLHRHIDPVISIVEASENLGYAAGNNVGIQRALAEDADLVWILNPDTVVEPETLTKMVAVTRRHPQVGIVGTRILNGGHRPPTIWFNGGVIDWSRDGATNHEDIGRRDADVRSVGVKPVDYVTGASMLIRREVFEDIGLIPEDYFLYFEETDFCTRAKRAGWVSAIDTGAVLRHYKRSTGALPAPYYVYYFCRGRLLFRRRFASSASGDVPEDLSEFIQAWRRRVVQNAPDWVDTYDRLVAWAIEDGLAGVGGRRDDITHVPAAVKGTS